MARESFISDKVRVNSACITVFAWPCFWAHWSLVVKEHGQDFEDGHWYLQTTPPSKHESVVLVPHPQWCSVCAWKGLVHSLSMWVPMNACHWRDLPFPAHPGLTWWCTVFIEKMACLPIPPLPPPAHAMLFSSSSSATLPSTMWMHHLLDCNTCFSPWPGP